MKEVKKIQNKHWVRTKNTLANEQGQQNILTLGLTALERSAALNLMNDTSKLAPI